MMVVIADIEDRYSLKAWLKEQPREVAVWIAWRGAARVLPVWWDAVLTEEWAHRRDLTALPVLRSLLISSVAAIGPAEDINAATTGAAAAAHAASTHAAAARATTQAAGRAANAAHAAANAAARAANAANAAARAAAAGDLVWAAIRLDVEQTAGGDIPDALALWPEGKGPLAKEWGLIKSQLSKSSDFAAWEFWIQWYDALLDGRPMLGDAARSWEMLEKIALIDAATWDAGPEVVNPVIREIWEGYQESVSTSGSASDPEPVSEDAKSAMKQRVAANRDALAVATAGLLEDIGAFKARVRGMNHLEPELREQVLAFVDEFTGKLSSLLEGLPGPGERVNDDQAGRLVLWLRDFRGFLGHKLSHYGSAENMAEAAVPTGIILGATGIGSMLGMPLAGSVVGGLIANQMKPGQAARELMKPSANNADTQ